MESHDINPNIDLSRSSLSEEMLMETDRLAGDDLSDLPNEDKIVGTEKLPASSFPLDAITIKGESSRVANSPPTDDPPKEQRVFNELYETLFSKSWDMWLGSILLSLFSILLFLIASPLGSIGGLNNLGQNLLVPLGFTFDGSTPSGIPNPTDHLYAMLVMTMLIGAFGSALLAREFAIYLPPKAELMKGLVGGILMGIGGSIGMGCTISGFYSSLPALSAGGLFFGLGLFIGVFLALKYSIWEAEHIAFMTAGKWNTYLSAPKQGGSWQPLAGIVVLVLGSLLIIPYYISSKQSFMGFIAIGLMVGVVLQRSRFCIYQAIYDPFLSGNSKPAKAIILGILVGILGFTVIKGMDQGSEGSFVFANFWIPGLIGGVIFGMGMTSAEGCSLSATWKAGEGHVKLWMAMVGILISMPLTGEYLKPRFLDRIPDSMNRAVFLPNTVGYGGAICLMLLVLFLWFVVVQWNEKSGILSLINERCKGKKLELNKEKLLTIVIVLILLSGTMVFTFEHQGHDDGNISPSEILLSKTRAYLFSGKSTIISAGELFSNLNDGYSGNDPYVISIRSRSQYVKAHIPGAVNIDYRNVFHPDTLSTLPWNKQIVVYCDSGHESTEIAVLLSIYGYDASSLEWGIASWTPNTTIASDFFDPSEVVNYPILQGPEPGSFSTETWVLNEVGQCGFEEPPQEDSVNEDEDEILRKIIDNSFNKERNASITASALFEILDDGDPANDPFILSLRSPPRYMKEHIPGAVNMDLETMFLENTLNELPNGDRSIVVVSDTIHFESEAAALLKINGYNATALKFGMASWSTNLTTSPVQYNRFEDCHNFPITVGPEAGSMESAMIAGKTDEEIVREASLFYLNQGISFTNATELYILLNDSTPENDPFLLSIQEPDLYELGHIPGAVNIQWQDLFSRANLSVLPDNERQIVVVGTVGQTSSLITPLLNLLGYRASYLQYGMCGWTTNDTVAPDCVDYSQQDGYPITSGSEPGSLNNETHPQITMGDQMEKSELPHEYPDFGTREWEIIRHGIEEYVNDAITSVITAEALYFDLIDDYPVNDPIMISIQTQEDYVKAHIPGALNMLISELMDKDTLSALPKDRHIVIISLDGEKASALTGLLNLDGYDAVSLRFGMGSWNYDKNTSSNPCVDPDARMNDYPLSDGSVIGTWSTGKSVK